MNNPYQSPGGSDVSRDGEAEPASSVMRPVDTVLLVVMLFACVVCWFSFLQWVDLSLKEMFDNPPSPLTPHFLTLSLLTGVTVEFVGLLYFVRRAISPFQAPLSAIGATLLMLAAFVPLVLLAQICLG